MALSDAKVTEIFYLDTKDLKPGVYLVKILTDQGETTIRVVRE